MFSIREALFVPQNEHDPPIDTIKFGKIGLNGDHCVYPYSHHAYLNRKYWFQQVEANTLLDAVKDWIQHM